ncbi:MAG: D-alanine--D-alanine ligase family protein [Actinomycetota bacterium]
MRVLVLFGGRSGEHEVSVISARSVVEALRSLGHDIVGVGITREGRWVRADPFDGDRISGSGEPYSLIADPQAPKDVDVAFPVLHGPYGEDGSLQGLLELADLPYVGAGVEGSAIGTNKVTHKRLFAEAGLPVVDFVAFTRDEWSSASPEILQAVDKLGYPCFTKPARLGSSVGISRVAEPGELEPAVERALVHDVDVLVEAEGYSRELEVGVIGEPPVVSVVGEVVPDGEFYDYRAKYLGDWTELRIPADVPSSVERAIHDYALRAFRAARCEGLARVDFFLDPATEALIVNEINSAPGLTPKSMFPRVWEASGKPFADVVAALLEHALARHDRKARLEAARAAAHDREISGA